MRSSGKPITWTNATSYESQFASEQEIKRLEALEAELGRASSDVL